MTLQVVMVKKRLASGEPCAKCLLAESWLRERGLWEQITRVVWADETDAESEGMRLARTHGVSLAPFFLVFEASDVGAAEPAKVDVLTSTLHLARRLAELAPIASAPVASGDPVAPAPELDPARAAHDLAGQHPRAIVAWALGRFGADCAIAFSGAEDVVLIDLAARSELPFSVFALDTGRLHPETLEFFDLVRQHYGVPIALVSPEAADVEALVRAKGTMSFRVDGHQECCGLRKVRPLARALSGRRAWMTGQRPDQSPGTRGGLPIIQADAAHLSPNGTPLVKLNPLAGWTSQDVWAWIRDHDVPFNPLHNQGYRSIGCAPCTRPVHPGQHEREGRWWWEESTKRECGLHLK